MAQPIRTRINIPELDKADGRAVLIFETFKPLSGGITSYARVEFVGDNFSTFAPFGDFSTRLEHNRNARATQAAMQAQHDRIFAPAVADALRGRALFHYQGPQTL
jgi:hypothetical protein